MNLNKTQQIGRVTKDPELKALPSGSKVCSFSVANNRVWKDANGAKKEETDFHNVVAFGKTAETIATWVKKGSLIYIEGRLKTHMWEKDGHKNYRTEIICENFVFGPKAAGTSTATTKPARDQEAEDGMDGIEFPDDDTINVDDIPF